MKRFFRVLCKTLCVVFICLFAVTLLHGKDDFTKPKEFGVYVKTEKGLKRLVPNIVFNEKGVLFVELNNPARFLLKRCSVFCHLRQIRFNSPYPEPFTFFQPSPLGKQRYILGKAIAFDLKKKSDDLYVVKPKELLGRGYMALWINDSAGFYY